MLNVGGETDSAEEKVDVDWLIDSPAIFKTL
jgi:hypothetical protein